MVMAMPIWLRAVHCWSILAAVFSMRLVLFTP